MTLALESLSGGYGDTLVHRDLSLSVAPGTVLGVIGRNGTGKSTLARLIGGELRSSSGRILDTGTDITRMPPWGRYRRGITVMPQTDPVFDALTVRDNLGLDGPADVARLVARFPRIAERMDQIAGSMSGGERKILGFVRALAAPSKIVVLDEPSEGVQPENIAHMQAVIAEARDRGVAFILLEQNITMVEALADEVVALEGGKIIYRAVKGDIDREKMLDAISL